MQSSVPISRPDDFLAEMLKTDHHMTQVKSRLLKQQVKIKSFEEKKQRTENKKFHKALKDFKMKAKHAEKRDNVDQINQLKKKIREKGDDMADEDFDNFMDKPQRGGGRRGGRGGSRGGGRGGGTLDKVRDSERQRQKSKNDFKASGKAGQQKKKKAQGSSKKGGA